MNVYVKYNINLNHDITRNSIIQLKRALNKCYRISRKLNKEWIDLPRNADIRYGYTEVTKAVKSGISVDNFKKHLIRRLGKKRFLKFKEFTSKAMQLEDESDRIDEIIVSVRKELKVRK